MNTQNATLRRIKVPVEPNTDALPGDFAWDFDSEQLGGDRNKPTHHLYLCLPGEKRLTAIQVQRGQPGGSRVWGWDGNEDKPTIMPSLHAQGIWHGWLRAGQLVSC